MEGVPMDKEAIGESNKLKDKLASSMLAIEKKHVRLPGEWSSKFTAWS